MKQTDKFCDHCVAQNHTIVQFCSDQGKSDDFNVKWFAFLVKAVEMSICLDLLKQGKCSGLYAT